MERRAELGVDEHRAGRELQRMLQLYKGLLALVSLEKGDTQEDPAVDTVRLLLQSNAVCGSGESRPVDSE